MLTSMKLVGLLCDHGRAPGFRVVGVGRAGSSAESAIETLQTAGCPYSTEIDTRPHILSAGKFGHLALAEGELERAVRLLGAAERLGESIGIVLAPVEQPNRERSIAAAKAASQAMALDEAIACALEQAR